MNCGPMTEPRPNVTEDAFLGGRLRLRQPKRAIAPAMTRCCWRRRRRRGRAIVSSISAPASAPRVLRWRRRVDGIELVLVEIDAALAELARGNAARNAIAGRGGRARCDAEAPALCGRGPVARQRRRRADEPAVQRCRAAPASPDPSARASAHVAHAATLRSWIHAARRILKSGGVLTLIWRADGIAEVLAALDRGFGSLAILPVHGDAGRAGDPRAGRAVKGGKAPTQILAGPDAQR